MVNCAKFLEDYSDYRDGLLESTAMAALSEHRAGCASCARYDEVVGAGVELFCNLPQIEPSADFLPRLQHQLYHIQDGPYHEGGRASGAPMAFTLALAAAIGMTAWLPLMRPRAATVELPPVVAHAPHRVEAVQVLFRAGPLLEPSASPSWAQPAANQTLLFRYTRLGSGAAYPTLPVSAQ